MTNIQPYTFQSCLKLTAITVDALNPAYSSLGGVLFDKNQTLLLQFPAGLGGSYAITDSVISIAPGAFMMCAGISSVTTPKSVTQIGDYTFYGCTFHSVTIPSSVTNLGTNAFFNPSSPYIATVFFGGNAPAIASSSVFNSNTRLYYLPETTGWGATLGGAPTKLWNPQAQTADGSFGLRTNKFGFNVTGTTNIPIVVEASTNLINWQPVQTNTLATGTAYFSDPKWTNYRTRYYRFRSP